MLNPFLRSTGSRLPGLPRYKTQTIIVKHSGGRLPGRHRYIRALAVYVMTTYRQALQTAKQRISEGELPASESGRILSSILNDETVFDCPHQEDDGSCSIVDVCENHPYGGDEPF